MIGLAPSLWARYSTCLRALVVEFVVCHALLVQVRRQVSVVTRRHSVQACLDVKVLQWVLIDWQGRLTHLYQLLSGMLRLRLVACRTLARGQDRLCRIVGFAQLL